MTVASRKVCQACGFGEKMRPQHYLQAKNAVGANCSWAPDRRVVDRRVVIGGLSIGGLSIGGLATQGGQAVGFTS